MAVREYQKREIAVAQLETALQLFLQSGDRLSVLTLAGAAEEILGKELEALGGTTALSTVQAATAAVARALQGKTISPKAVAMIANRARNAVKHLDASGPQTVWMDPEEEAREMLDRATTNYYRLTEDQTDLMGQFLWKVYG
jgi:hypothetical protein